MMHRMKRTCTSWQLEKSHTGARAKDGSDGEGARSYSREVGKKKFMVVVSLPGVNTADMDT